MRHPQRPCESIKSVGELPLDACTARDKQIYPHTTYVSYIVLEFVQSQIPHVKFANTFKAFGQAIKYDKLQNNKSYNRTQ